MRMDLALATDCTELPEPRLTSDVTAGFILATNGVLWFVISWSTGDPSIAAGAFFLITMPFTAPYWWRSGG